MPGWFHTAHVERPSHSSRCSSSADSITVETQCRYYCAIYFVMWLWFHRTNHSSCPVGFADTAPKLPWPQWIHTIPGRGVEVDSWDSSPFFVVYFGLDLILSFPLFDTLGWSWCAFLAIHQERLAVVDSCLRHSWRRVGRTKLHL